MSGKLILKPPKAESEYEHPTVEAYDRSFTTQEHCKDKAKAVEYVKCSPLPSPNYAIAGVELQSLRKRRIRHGRLIHYNEE